MLREIMVSASYVYPYLRELGELKSLMSSSWGNWIISSPRIKKTDVKLYTLYFKDFQQGYQV